MKKPLVIIIFLLFFSTPSYTETLNLFCLIDTLQLKKAKLDEKEYNRFAGKVIKLKINFKENLIYDISEDSQMSVISGINLGVKNFRKTTKGLNYTSEQVMRGDKNKTIKYIYNNDISISEDNRKGRLISRIDQSGISIKNFIFSIPCRWYDYTNSEILIASRGLINKQQKKGGRSLQDINEWNKEKIDYTGTFKKKKENIDPKKQIVNLEDYSADNQESLLYLYKAKFFKNKITNTVFLKYRNYLKFEPGQIIKFDDIKDLSERHFFGLPLLDSIDRSRLKKLKKEYLKKKKQIKKSG